MSQFSQASILVADTDADSLLNIASILSGENHRVLTANDAVTAIESSQQAPLDLLITDTRLGRWSGIELITTIRLDPDMRDLPVMFISAHQIPGVIRRTYDSGDAFHVKKPIDRAVLIELVEKALWLPHLIKSHIEQNLCRQPHFQIAPTDQPASTPIHAPIFAPTPTGNSLGTPSFIAGPPTAF